MIEKRRKEVNEEIKLMENRYKQDIEAIEEGKMSKAEMDEMDYSPYNSDNDNDIPVASLSLPVKKEKDEHAEDKTNNKRHHTEDDLENELDDFLMRPIKKEKHFHENSHTDNGNEKH
jgi:hypothetical protein